MMGYKHGIHIFRGSDVNWVDGNWVYGVYRRRNKNVNLGTDTAEYDPSLDGQTDVEEDTAEEVVEEPTLKIRLLRQKCMPILLVHCTKLIRKMVQ